jgi:hypothetical protein
MPERASASAYLQTAHFQLLAASAATPPTANAAKVLVMGRTCGTLV